MFVIKSTLQALISVIPKEGKDPTQCGSYCPISPLNTDLTLLVSAAVTFSK